MARPKAKNVDYFPCYCKDGKTLYILESRWGNNGYAFFYKLWKRLGDADLHYIDLRPLDNWEYFRARMVVSDTETHDILNKLAEMGVIDPGLWAHKIIWSDSFIESVKDVWVKRKQDIPQKPSFLIQKQTLLGPLVTETPISGIHNPQSKVKESKVKKSIIRKHKTPLPEDFNISTTVQNWAKQKGHSRLQEHLESFKAKCRANGYQYIDWDSAFMEAIRSDWAKLRPSGGNGNGTDKRGHGQGGPGIPEYTGEVEQISDKQRAENVERLKRLTGTIATSIVPGKV